MDGWWWFWLHSRFFFAYTDAVRLKDKSLIFDKRTDELSFTNTCPYGFESWQSLCLKQILKFYWNQIKMKIDLGYVYIKTRPNMSWCAEFVSIRVYICHLFPSLLMFQRLRFLFNDMSLNSFICRRKKYSVGK